MQPESGRHRRSHTVVERFLAVVAVLIVVGVVGALIGVPVYWIVSAGW